jgi:ferredoxin
MRITVDKLRCIGAGQCVLNAPKIFDQNEDDGMVILLNENPPPELHESARLAARLCPAEVIKIHEKK